MENNPIAIGECADHFNFAPFQIKPHPQFPLVSAMRGCDDVIRPGMPNVSLGNLGMPFMDPRMNYHEL